MSDVQLFQLSLETGELSLSLLVELHLSSSVGTCLLQPRSNVLDVLLQHGATLLSLRPVASFNSQLLIELLQPSSQLLRLLGVLRSQSCFIIDLSGKGATLLVLTSGSALELSFNSLQVSHSLLGQLQVTLHLPLALIHICLDLLLALEGIFSFIESLLQLSLDSREMVALILGSLDVLLRPLAAIGAGSFLLSKLGDHVALMGNLFLQGADLIILVRPFLLCLHQDAFLNSYLVLKGSNGRVSFFGSVLPELLSGTFPFDPPVDSLEVLLDISGLVLNPDSLVNDL